MTKKKTVAKPKKIKIFERDCVGEMKVGFLPLRVRPNWGSAFSFSLTSFVFLVWLVSSSFSLLPLSIPPSPANEGAENGKGLLKGFSFSFLFIF